MSVTGKWNLTIKAPTGAMATILELNDDNGTLSGVQSGQGSSNPIAEVKFDGVTIQWVNQITKPMKMKLEFTGAVEGNAMNGKVKAGFMGSFPFIATRE